MACAGWLTILEQNPPTCWCWNSLGKDLWSTAMGFGAGENSYPSTLQGIWLWSTGPRGESWADYVCNVRAWEPWLSSIMMRLIKVNSSADFKNTKGYGSKSGIWTFKIPSERKKLMLLISAFWKWNGKEINVFLQIITLKTLCHILDGSVFESYLSRKKDFFQ